MFAQVGIVWEAGAKRPRAHRAALKRKGCVCRKMSWEMPVASTGAQSTGLI